MTLDVLEKTEAEPTFGGTVLVVEEAKTTPRVSVFTPSHDTRYLVECYTSLKNQMFSDWEWIVLLNQAAQAELVGSLPRIFEADDRVKLHLTALPPVIGALKAEAVSKCSGEILVELDHDDILMPTALQEVVAAFDVLPKVGFVYSDFAQINADGSPNTDKFDARFGWKYDTEGHYEVCRSMSDHPHNYAYIWYAPNHIRAFRRAVYDHVGGYDESLDILDDQDLMCQMAQVTEFHHILSLLYLQRVGAHNTQRQADKNARIQVETVRMYDEYIQPLMLKWANDRRLLCLDLGGAFNPMPGYKTLDLHDADFVGDVFELLAKMPDNSVGVIRAVDFFEHIADKVKLWNEMYRVLADGGMVLSLTPSADGRGAFMDPTHVAFYNEPSFWYFSYASHKNYVPELKVNFHVSRLVTYFPSPWHEQHNIPYVCANLVADKGSYRLGGMKELN